VGVPRHRLRRAGRAVTVQWDASAARERIKRAATVGVLAATNEISNVANELILSPPKTGRIYRRRGVEHQASAPGESPASDTGALVASSTATVVDLDPVIRGTANWSSEHAAPLELGTVKMEPRPFARVALDLVGGGAFVRATVGHEVGAELRTAGFQRYGDAMDSAMEPE
jgi:hypothetical protein